MSLAGVILMAVFGLTPHAEQIPDSLEARDKCGNVENVPSHFDKTPPLIYGKPYVVPRLRFHILDAQTGTPIIGREVIVHYSWRWFEYPLPENLFGGWTQSSVLRKCVTDNLGFLEIPEFQVTPSGWYSGKFLLGRKPEFSHLEVSVHWEKRITSFSFNKSSIERYQKEKTNGISLRVPAPWK